ncbi:hypothetical protein F4680DRAFT_449535 [Xylaria scruposa]|nr:hypothetical protein F4680DRAFT_449535 [Xylaria scruposa]
MDPVPALTTIFTPVPECSDLYVNFCHEDGCDAFLGLDNGVQSCIPGYTPDNNKAYTYSPGLFCPLGMTPASSLSLLSAVYCCYNGYHFDAEFYGCLANLTEGSFIISNSNPSGLPSTFAFGPNQTDSFNSVAAHWGGLIYTGRPTIFATAPAIFLVGQNLAVTSESTPAAPAYTTSSLPQTSSQGLESIPPKDVPSKSKTLQIGIAVGVSVGGVLLLCLGFFWFMVYRKRLRREHRVRVENEELNQQHQEEYKGKPELEGSAGDPFRLIKSELDALAIRAELEGTAVDETGAGINVIKPELEGSLGKQGLLSVYVKRKAELEASATIHGTVNSGKSLPSSEMQSRSTGTETSQLAESESSR